MNQTGIIYDEKMCLHKEGNGKSDHPESPDRIKYIFNEIVRKKLLEKCTLVDIREATDTEILSIHTENHLIQMQKIPHLHKQQLNEFKKLYNSIYFNKHSLNSALLSCGGVIELCDQVVQNKLSNGIAIVRPPGHHAEGNCCMGFCLFNNVAVAAQTMINKHSLKRIVIIDWDVHHGNGTQHIFESDSRVLYISIHRYDHARFYPYSTDAGPEKVGISNGTGFNVNIAWNTSMVLGSKQIGDTEYIYAFETLIKPMLIEYDPELIIISAGFDCGKGDPLGGLNVTPAAFNYMTAELMNFAKGKIVIVLEGGYNLKTISKSMIACLRALLKLEPIKLKIDDRISQDAIDAIRATSLAHKSYWKFLQ